MPENPCTTNCVAAAAADTVVACHLKSHGYKATLQSFVEESPHLMSLKDCLLSSGPVSFEFAEFSDAEVDLTAILASYTSMCEKYSSLNLMTQRMEVLCSQMRSLVAVKDVIPNNQTLLYNKNFRKPIHVVTSPRHENPREPEPEGPIGSLSNTSPIKHNRKKRKPSRERPSPDENVVGKGNSVASTASVSTNLFDSMDYDDINEFLRPLVESGFPSLLAGEINRTMLNAEPAEPQSSESEAQPETVPANFDLVNFLDSNSMQGTSCSFPLPSPDKKIREVSDHVENELWNTLFGTVEVEPLCGPPMPTAPTREVSDDRGQLNTPQPHNAEECPTMSVSDLTDSPMMISKQPLAGANHLQCSTKDQPEKHLTVKVDLSKGRSQSKVDAKSRRRENKAKIDAHRKKGGKTATKLNRSAKKNKSVSPPPPLESDQCRSIVRRQLFSPSVAVNAKRNNVKGTPSKPAPLETQVSTPEIDPMPLSIPDVDCEVEVYTSPSPMAQCVSADINGPLSHTCHDAKTSSEEPVGLIHIEMGETGESAGTAFSNAELESAESLLRLHASVVRAMKGNIVVSQPTDGCPTSLVCALPILRSNMDISQKEALRSPSDHEAESQSEPEPYDAGVGSFQLPTSAQNTPKKLKLSSEQITSVLSRLYPTRTS